MPSRSPADIASLDDLFACASRRQHARNRAEHEALCADATISAPGKLDAPRAGRAKNAESWRFSCIAIN